MADSSQLGPARAHQGPRRSRVEEGLSMIESSLRQPDAPNVYVTRDRLKHSSQALTMGGLPKASVDIGPQVRDMARIDAARREAEAMVGPRRDWQAAHAPPRQAPMVEGQYVAKLDRSLQRNAGSTGRALGPAGAGGAVSGGERRSWGAGRTGGGGALVAAPSALSADIAELRGNQRLRQYLRDRKHVGEEPMQLLTDQVEAAAQATGAPTTLPGVSAAGPVVYLNEAAPAPSSRGFDLRSHLQARTSLRRMQQHLQSALDEDGEGAAEGRSGGGAGGGAEARRVSGGGVVGVVSAYAQEQAGAAGVAARLRRPASAASSRVAPAPTTLVLVELPAPAPAAPSPNGPPGGLTLSASSPQGAQQQQQQQQQHRQAQQQGAGPQWHRTASSNSFGSRTMPGSLASPSTSNHSFSSLASGYEAPGSPMRGAGTGAGHCTNTTTSSPHTSASIGGAVLEGFVPGVEKYHTTYALPSRALVNGVDLPTRDLANAAQLVEVVEVLAPPRMLPPGCQLPPYSPYAGGAAGGGGEAGGAGGSMRVRRNSDSIAWSSMASRGLARGSLSSRALQGSHGEGGPGAGPGGGYYGAAGGGAGAGGAGAGGGGGALGASRSRRNSLAGPVGGSVSTGQLGGPWGVTSPGSSPGGSSGPITPSPGCTEASFPRRNGAATHGSATPPSLLSPAGSIRRLALASGSGAAGSASAAAAAAAAVLAASGNLYRPGGLSAGGMVSLPGGQERSTEGGEEGAPAGKGEADAGGERSSGKQQADAGAPRGVHEPTVVGPHAFALMAAVVEEAAPVSTTAGVVPALVTSRHQIVVPSAAVAAAPAPAGLVPQSQAGGAAPQLGAAAARRVKANAVAQLSRSVSLGRPSVAAAPAPDAAAGWLQRRPSGVGELAAAAAAAAAGPGAGTPGGSNPGEAVLAAQDAHLRAPSRRRSSLAAYGMHAIVEEHDEAEGGEAEGARPAQLQPAQAPVGQQAAVDTSGDVGGVPSVPQLSRTASGASAGGAAGEGVGAGGGWSRSSSTGRPARPSVVGPLAMMAAAAASAGGAVQEQVQRAVQVQVREQVQPAVQVQVLEQVQDDEAVDAGAGDSAAGDGAGAHVSAGAAAAAAAEVSLRALPSPATSATSAPPSVSLTPEVSSVVSGAASAAAAPPPSSIQAAQLHQVPAQLGQEAAPLRAEAEAAAAGPAALVSSAAKQVLSSRWVY